MDLLAPTTILWLILGLVAGGAFIAYSKSFGRARRKVFANGLIIAAVIYVFFALTWGLSVWLLYELIGVGIFGAFARLGIRGSPSWIAAGWVLHPLWDAGLHLHGTGASFAPEWYVLACISFDVLVGVFIQLRRHIL